MIVSFLEPFGNHIKLTMMLADNHSERVGLYFPFPEVVSFLVLILKYNVGRELMQELKKDDSITMPFVGDDGQIAVYTGKVLSIRENWITDPFEAIVVVWGTEESSVSPWEITAKNEKAFVPLDQAVIVSRYGAPIVSTVTTLLENPRFRMLWHVPDPRVSREYYELVKMPLSLSVIRERLLGCWYRKFNGVKGDIALLVKNSLLVSEELKFLAIEAGRTIISALDEVSQKLREKAEANNRAQAGNQDAGRRPGFIQAMRN
jgi:hypothetical protein